VTPCAGSTPLIRIRHLSGCPIQHGALECWAGAAPLDPQTRRLGRRRRTRPSLGSGSSGSPRWWLPPTGLEHPHEKRSVQRVEPDGNSRQAGRKRVVARRSERDPLEAVVGAQLLEGPAREQPQVRTTRIGVRLSALGIERVAEDQLVAHVHGHGLPTERERGDVVPARQVVGRDARKAPRREHPANLVEESVRAADMLDHLVGMHDVERLAREWQAVLEVGTVHLDPTLAGRGGMLLDELHPDDPRGTEAGGHAQRKCPVARAEVQQARSWRGREHLEDGAPIFLLGGPKESPEIPHGLNSPLSHPRRPLRAQPLSAARAACPGAASPRASPPAGTRTVSAWSRSSAGAAGPAVCGPSPTTRPGPGAR
jgi:hypothetical protein